MAGFELVESEGLDEPSWLIRLLPYLDQANLHALWDEYQPYGDNPATARNKALSVFLCPSKHSAETATVPDELVSITSPCGCPAGNQLVPGGAIGDYAANHGDLSPGAVNAPTDFYWGGNGTGVIVSCRPKGDETEIERDWLDKVSMSDVSDGTSNTLLIGELHVPRDSDKTAPFNGPAYVGRYLTHYARLGGPGVPLAHHPDDQRANVLSFGSPHAGVVQFTLTDGSVRPIATSLSTRVLGYLSNRHDGESPGQF